MTSFRVFLLLVVVGVTAGMWALTCAAWRAEQVMDGVRPLEARSFPALTLVTLGTGGPYENPDRRGPAMAVAREDRVVLVDAGRAVAEALRAARIPVSQPRTVLLTSLLPENTVGLDDLLATGWLDGRDAPLRVVGPPGVAALVAGLAAAHGPALSARAAALGLDPTGARFEALEVGDGWSEAHAAFAIRAGALPGGPVPALAWRFEWGDRSLVVASAGWAPEALVAFARGARVLVHEAAYVPEPELAAEIGLDVDPARLAREAALHTSIEGAGRLASRAGVETLVLVRLRPPPVYDLQITGIVDDHFSGRIWLPEDGDELTP